MTTPVTPPAAPVVPLYPPLGSPTFNQDAYTYGSSMPAVSAALGDLADNVAVNAQISHDNAQTSVVAANNAASAAEAAMGATNFKGAWTSLTGALAKPATVKHNNRFWLLLNNLADVTTSQPGVSADWTATDVGALIQNFASSGTVAVGVKSVATVAGITLTIPTLQQGEEVEVVNISADEISINWSGQTVKGKTPVSPFMVPALRGFRVTSNGVTLA